MRTIIQMVQLTRLDCAIASAGLMRMALTQALHHARHRIVFQKRLVDQPMMASVLADMALEAEAAVALVMRLCRSFDLAASDPREAMQQTKAEAESQPLPPTTPPGLWQGNTSCTSCRCRTDRDHCVRPSWITLGLAYNSILSILADRHRIDTPSLGQN